MLNRQYPLSMNIIYLYYIVKCIKLYMCIHPELIEQHVKYKNNLKNKTNTLFK